MEKIGHRDRCENAGKISRYSRCEEKTERECRRAPGRHAIGTRDQLTNATLNPTAARFFFDFAMTGAANVTDKWRAHDSRDAIFRDDPAEFVGCDSEEREIKQAWFLWELVIFKCDPSQCRGAA